MRSVSMRLVDLERKPLIPLGFEGENEYMTINFDCKTVFDKHPVAVPTLAVTPPQGDSYPAVVVRDGDIVSWTVCDSDLVYPGEGELQLTFVDGTIIGKTYKARTKVLDSITPSGEAPTPIQNWLIQAAAALQALPTEVANSIKKAYVTLEMLWENYMQNGKVNPVAGIFLGKNNYGYQDKTEYVVTPNKREEDYSIEDIKARYSTPTGLLEESTGTPTDSETDQDD